MIKTHKFSDIFSFQKKSKVKAGDGLTDGLYPFFTSSPNLTKRYNEAQFDGESLIFGTGGLPSIHFCNQPFAVSTDCLVAHSKTKLEVKFVYYYLLINIWILENGFKGAGLKHISKSYLSDIHIPLPELEEQKHIVAILDQANALRQKRQKAISLLDDYLKAVFLEMFGDPVTNPKGWGVTKIGKIIEDIRYGSSEKSADFQTDSSVAILRIPNILNGYVNYNDLKYQSLSEKEEGKLTLLEGDILFVRTNGNPDYIGRCAVFENNRKCIFASYLIRVRLKEDCGFNPVFIRYCLSLDSYRGKIRKESRTTAGNYNINTKGIKNFDLISPPKEMQDKFIRIMREVENLQQSMFTQSEELNINFHALMQKAFNH